MSWFARDSERDDLDIGYDPTAEGLPFGFEQPPDDRLDEVAGILDDDVDTACPLGFPDSSHPIRPMHIEEAVVLIHDETQSEYTRWAQRHQSRLPALLVTAQTRLAEVTGQHDELTGKVDEATTELDVQRAQLSDPDLKVSGPVRTLLQDLAPLAAIGLVGLEVTALQPILGQVIRLPDWKAWCLAIFAVLVIMLTSYLAGVVLHRWLTYEGPRRIRRAHAAVASGLLMLGLASLGGIVGIRLLVSKEDLVASLLYVAMQGGVQAGCALHGWWQHNPRVRQVKATERQLVELTESRDGLAERIAEVADWEETLAQFRLIDWLTSRREALAEGYAATVLRISRSARCHELSRLGHSDSVNTVQLLPMPKFTPPVDPADDDGLDWLSGIVLTL